MKRLIVMALAVVMLISVAPAPAQSGMGLFATWWDGKDMGDGFGGGVKYEFPLIPIVSIDARASYIKFSDATLSPTTDNGLYTIPLEAVGSLKFGLFYGGLALGYYIWGGSDLSTNSQIGGSILAGVSLGLGSIGAFGELRYTKAETRVEDTFDMKADGWNILLGVKF